MSISDFFRRLAARVERWYWHVTDNVPAALRPARPFLIETEISALTPLPMRTRPDAVYQLPDSTLVVTDTKHRSEWAVYWGDIAQLSVAAWVLRHTTDPDLSGLPVCSFGYVRLVHRGQTRYKRVELLPDQTVATLWLSSWAHPLPARVPA
jgi:hypothetical protein